jgi:hypothetical protein
VLEVLARTSTPVRRLMILIIDASAPGELFPQLAARLPHLEALHVVALMQKYDLVRTRPLSSSLFRLPLPWGIHARVLSFERAGHVAGVGTAA